MIHTLTEQEYNEYTKEWEAWSDLQGSWPYEPAVAFLDQEAKQTKPSKLDLHKLVTQTV